MSKPCIFLGFVDIAGQIQDYKNGYEALGYKTFTFVFTRNELFKENQYNVALFDLYPNIIKKYPYLRKIYTLLIIIPIKYIILIKAMFCCSVFHFMWFTEKWNFFFLWFLKLLNKKIIVSFVGSDIRWMPLWISEFTSKNLFLPEQDLLMKNSITSKVTLEEKVRYIRVFEKYSDLILSVGEQAQLQLRPYNNFYLPIDLNNINFKITENSIPKVAIGVTESNFKNSNRVIREIIQFQQTCSIKFSLIIIENKTHHDALEILSDSDIFVYSPYVSGPGKFGIEALAAGALLLTGNEDSFYTFKEPMPIVKINPKNYLEILNYYLQNPTERNEIINKGRKWALKYANATWICKDILDNINSGGYDYYPTFFRENAMFDTKWDQANSKQILNKWTKYVSNCDWYKDNIEPGERSELIF